MSLADAPFFTIAVVFLIRAPSPRTFSIAVQRVFCAMIGGFSICIKPLAVSAAISRVVCGAAVVTTTEVVTAAVVALVVVALVVVALVVAALVVTTAEVPVCTVCCNAENVSAA